MNRNGIIGLIILVIVIAGGWYLLRPSRTSTTGTMSSNSMDNSAAPPAAQSTTTTPPSSGTTVTYTTNGFTPSTLTVKKGATVTFVNQSGGRMWVASDPHPIHNFYSGTALGQHCPDTAGVAFDQCRAGDSYTFVFNKVGSWGYHNHTSAGDTGTVVVTQ